MSLLHYNFPSKYLRGNTDVNIILPDLPQGAVPEAFYGSGEKYPVLWLLHGGTEDYSVWVRKSNIELYATENRLIVVMPSVMNSSYSDWAHFGGGYLAHEYIVRELMPLVYGWFPASPKREDNFMAGSSMGGNGAWKFAVNYPEKFAACAMFSAAVPDFRARYEADVKSGQSSHISDLVNMYGGLEALLASKENTMGVAEALVRRGGAGQLPRLLASVGEDDHVLRGVVGAVEYFRSLGIAVELRTVPGYGHEWRFWERSIQEALAFFGFRV